MSMFALYGQRALVTGANTGIGQAIAVGLAGAEVLCAGRRDCEETVTIIERAGGTAISVPADLADSMVGQGLLDETPVDILINDAGIIRRADAVDFPEGDWDAVMDVDLEALFFATQAFARAVLARGGQGRVVKFASLLSFQGGIRAPSCTASKHGVAGLTKLPAN